MEELELTEAIELWKAASDEIKGQEKAFKESLAEAKEAVENLEREIINAFRSRRITSMGLTMGTPYISRITRAKVEDTEAFFDFVLSSGRTELLFARAADKAVEEYISMAKVPPPGVKVEISERLNFRTKQ